MTSMKSLVAVLTLALVGKPPAAAERRAVLTSLASLAEGSKEVRAEAARFAGAMHLPLFVDPLRGLLLAPEPEVRKAAAGALGDLGVPRTSADLNAVLDALGRAASDPDDGVAEAAVEALGRFPFPEVRTTLSRLAHDAKRTEKRRKAAARALSRPISAESRERLEAWLAISTREADASAGAAATPERPVAFAERWGVAEDDLVRAARDLLDPDPALHLKAAADLAAAGEPNERLPFLRRALRDRDVGVRRIAAEALAKKTALPFVLALVPASRDADLRVRTSATIALTASKPWPDVTRAVAERFRDETDLGLRKHLAAALATAPSGDALAAVASWQQGPIRDEVRRELIPIVATRVSSAAAAVLTTIAVSAHEELVADKALEALASRDDRQVVPPLLSALERSRSGKTSRRRLLRALAGRTDPRITRSIVRLAERDGADDAAIALLKTQPDARPALLTLAENDKETVRALALKGLEDARGKDVVEVLARLLSGHPEADGAFRLLLRQDKALILDPLLRLLGEPEQAPRREAILYALRGRRDPRIASPVAATALASPRLALVAIDVLRVQPEADAVPALAKLADSTALDEDARAGALRAMADFGSEEITGLVRPLAKDSAIEVRMAARNALHTLDPELYPKWDPYGRVPLVAEAAGFGAGMMLLASQIAQADLTPFFTGAVGMILGGATPFLLTLNEDVTLGDAGFFGTIAAWGTLGGWGLGGSLQLTDQGTRWATLGGEILGLTVGALAMKNAEWSLDEAALVNFSSAEAGMMTASVFALAKELSGTSADARNVAYAGLLGGAVGTVPIALFARTLRADGNLLPVSTAMAYGAWLGAFAPGVLIDGPVDGTRALAGLVAGQGLGYFAGLAFAQVGEMSPRSVEFSALGGAAGASMLTGLALSIDGLGDRTLFGMLEAGTAAGALTMGLLAPRLEFHDNDVAIVVLSALGGAVGGAQFSVRAAEHTFDQRSFPGGILLGVGAGTFGGLVLSQIVDVSDKTLTTTLLGGAVLGVAGSGLGYMVPNLSIRPRSNITSLGIVGGLALTFPFAESLSLRSENLVYGALVGGAFTYWGAIAPAYWHSGQPNDTPPSSEIGGGAAFGSALGFAAGTVVSQALTLDAHSLGMSTLGTVAGTAIGGGLGLLFPEIEGHAATAIIQGAGLAGLGGFTLLSQLTTAVDLAGPGGDGTLATHVAAFALHGAWHGGLIPYVRHVEQPDASEVGGGMIFGAGLGAVAGVAALKLLERPLEAPDLVEASLFAAAANGIAAGTGLLAQDQRTGAVLMEGLGISGYGLALLAAPHTDYAARDSASFLFMMSALGWMGGWLPSTFSSQNPTQDQTAGGVLAGASLGVLAGALYTQLAAERQELEMSLMTAGASGLGGSLGLLFSGIDGQKSAMLLEGATALGLGAGLVFAPRTHYTDGDRVMVALMANAGAWQGYWGVRSFESTPSTGRQAGGVIFGSSLGLLSGLALSQVLDPEVDDVAKTAFLAMAAGAIGGGLTLSLPSANDTDTARALELSGLGGLAAFALIAPSFEFETRDSTMISMLAAFGGWHGALLPSLWTASPLDVQRSGGGVFGLGTGALSGAVLAQFIHRDYEDQAETLFYGLAGNAVGGGLGLLAPTIRSDAAAALIDGAGIAALGLALALSPMTTYTTNDKTLVGVGTAFGFWQGLWLPALFYDPQKPIPDTSTLGGAVFGAGVGAIASGVLSQFVELDAAEQVKASVPYLFASSIGAGAGLLAPSFDRRATIAVMEGAGVVGLTAGLLLAKSTEYSGGDLGLVTVGTAIGGGLGLTLPTLLALDNGTIDQRTGGGALLGAGLFGAAAAALAQATEYKGSDVEEIGLLSVTGAGLGFGLGLMIPDADRRLQFALLDGGALVALAAGLSFAPVIDVAEKDMTTFLVTGMTGAFMGAFAPALWNNGGVSSLPSSQVGGGIMFGTSLGLASGLVLSQVTSIDGEARKFGALGGAVGALSGSGLGLLLSTDDKVAVGLMEGMTLAGATALALTGPRTEFGGKDLALGTAYVGYLTWHTMGLTLLLQGSDRQAAGATMATIGLGTVTGMYLAPYIDLSLSKVLMLLAGNVWGTWIGGWGGAILRDHINHDLETRQSAGLTLLSTVLGSDVGLTVTGLVVGGLLDVKPTRFAVINLAGLGGMMIGMLSAGFAKQEPLKEGNVIGSLAGLVAGTVITGFFNFDESPTWDQLLATENTDPAAVRADEARLESRRTSKLPIGIDTWFPSARVAPGASGAQEYVFSVMGTWH